MTKFVQNVAEIRRNLKSVRDYLISGDEKSRYYVRDRLRLGYNLVAGAIEGDAIFGPSRFIGYRMISINKHISFGENGDLDGRETNPIIENLLGPQITSEDSRWKMLEERFLAFCERIDVVPVKRERKFWIMDDAPSRFSRLYNEGILSYHITTRYERNVAARNACIAYHGISCAVCKMDFETVYGELGRGFIHVHHTKPLHRYSAEDKTDPSRDLVPVCPNCHYMLHRVVPPLSLEKLRKLIEGAAKKN